MGSGVVVVSSFISNLSKTGQMSGFFGVTLLVAKELAVFGRTLCPVLGPLPRCPRAYTWVVILSDKHLFSPSIAGEFRRARLGGEDFLSKSFVIRRIELDLTFCELVNDNDAKHRLGIRRNGPGNA